MYRSVCVRLISIQKLVFTKEIIQSQNNSYTLYFVDVVACCRLTHSFERKWIFNNNNNSHQTHTKNEKKDSHIWRYFVFPFLSNGVLWPSDDWLISTLPYGVRARTPNTHNGFEQMHFNCFIKIQTHKLQWKLDCEPKRQMVYSIFFIFFAPQTRRRRDTHRWEREMNSIDLCIQTENKSFMSGRRSPLKKSGSQIERNNSIYFVWRLRARLLRSMLFACRNSLILLTINRV